MCTNDLCCVRFGGGNWNNSYSPQVGHWTDRRNYSIQIEFGEPLNLLGVTYRNKG